MNSAEIFTQPNDGAVPCPSDWLGVTHASIFFPLGVGRRPIFFPRGVFVPRGTFRHENKALGHFLVLGGSEGHIALHYGPRFLIFLKPLEMAGRDLLQQRTPQQKVGVASWGQSPARPRLFLPAAKHAGLWIIIGRRLSFVV